MASSAHQRLHEVRVCTHKAAGDGPARRRHLCASRRQPPPLVNRRLQADALRTARLDAAQARYQLEAAQAELDDLRHQVAAALSSAAQPPASTQLEEQLAAARLEAADAHHRLQLTELELAKQLDALGELQWQLDCVVQQLGLGAGIGGDGATTFPVTAPGSGQDASAATPDLMELLSRVEELQHTRLHLGESQRRLAAAERELARRQRQAADAPPVGVAVPAGADEPGSGGGSSELGAGGRQLVAEVVGENQALRQRLADAEVRSERCLCGRASVAVDSW